MNTIPLIVPNITEEDIQCVNNVLRSGMLVQGAESQDLEKKIASFIGTSHAASVSNGTATLHLSLLALEIGPGDEVIVPAFSYVATANVVELVGAKPVFVDIDIRTFNIDADKIESAITANTKAIIPVHEFGLACDISKVAAIAKKHGLALIEDAACALGATENGKHVGSFGDVGSFSFHPRKAITSGEGGIVTTSNESLAERIKILRNHGIRMHEGKMDFVAAGFNYRLTDFQSALITSQLKRLTGIIAYKNELAEVYFNEINNSLLTLPIIPEGKNHTWQTFHVIVDESMNRDTLINHLKEMGIGTNYGAQCIPAQTYYMNKYNSDCEAFYPNALKAYKQGLAIPLYDKLNKSQVQYISSTLNKLTSNASK